MKYNTITALIGLLAIYSINAQEYVPFPAEDAQWNIYLLSTCDNDSPPDTLLLKYVLDGDTTIQGNDYRKLCLLEQNVDGEIGYRSVGGIREEDKRIYYRGEGFIGSVYDEEFLLYDFNKQEGETIVHNYQSSSDFTSIVLDVDSILIGEKYRKRYKVQTGWWFHDPDYIVEGIGSILNGLLGRISDIPTCGYHYWEHVCYKEKDEVLYLNSNFPTCTAGLEPGNNPQFPSPGNLRGYVDYIELDSWGDCSGTALYGPAYCTRLSWDAPDISTTTSTLVSYTIYYKSSLDLTVYPLATVSTTHIEMELGIMGWVWVTANYSNPNGESEPSNAIFNGDLPIGIQNIKTQGNDFIYYNSGNQEIVIQNTFNNYRVNIIDINGRTIISKADEESVNISDLPRGMYLIELLYDDNKRIRRKIIK